jgi:hypothetical protein
VGLRAHDRDCSTSQVERLNTSLDGLAACFSSSSGERQESVVQSGVSNSVVGRCAKATLYLY